MVFSFAAHLLDERPPACSRCANCSRAVPAAVALNESLASPITSSSFRDRGRLAPMTAPIVSPTAPTISGCSRMTCAIAFWARPACSATPWPAWRARSDVLCPTGRTVAHIVCLPADRRRRVAHRRCGPTHGVGGYAVGGRQRIARLAGGILGAIARRSHRVEGGRSRMPGAVARSSQGTARALGGALRRIAHSAGNLAAGIARQVVEPLVERLPFRSDGIVRHDRRRVGAPGRCWPAHHQPTKAGCDQRQRERIRFDLVAEIAQQLRAAMAARKRGRASSRPSANSSASSASPFVARRLRAITVPSSRSPSASS